VYAVIVAVSVGRLVAFDVWGKLYSFYIGWLAGALAFGDLDVIIRRSASAFRRWCDLDSDRWSSTLGLSAFPAFEVFDQQ
jgi:hypothetical protein